MLTHPPDRIWAEVASLADRLHWSLEDILDLAHPDRRRVLAELRRLDQARRTR